MGNKRVLALRKQLKREQLHVQWLEQHLPTHVSSTAHSSESHSCVCWNV
jgi:ferritin-like metal-binding protein YciE